MASLYEDQVYQLDLCWQQEIQLTQTGNDFMGKRGPAFYPPKVLSACILLFATIGLSLSQRADFIIMLHEKFQGAYNLHAVRTSVCPLIPFVHLKPFLHNHWTKFYETSYLNSLEQCANASFPVSQFWEGGVGLMQNCNFS